MSRVNKFHPAVKHGAYAATTVLPGEDPAAFEKLHQDLIAELAPTGALEEDIVATMARRVWRKQNLRTIRSAELAQKRCLEIRSKKLPSVPLLLTFEHIDPAKHEKAIRAAEEEAREELGDTYRLVEIGEAATVDRLMEDLAIEERLDAMIDKCLKRLLLLRGVKSISAASPSVPQQRIAGPTRAA